MAIRDTIAAARKEAADAGGILSRDNGAADKSDAGRGNRRSAARAKPARDAAASVRVMSTADAKAGRSGKRSSEMTREERKAERAAKRSDEDRRVSATDVLLNRQEAYRRGRRVWWILIGVGITFTVISFILTRAFPVTDASNAPYAVASIIALVIAYALIIWAFIYDWRKIKPMRTAAADEVGRLSSKKVDKLLREGAEEREARKGKRG